MFGDIKLSKITFICKLPGLKVLKHENYQQKDYFVSIVSNIKQFLGSNRQDASFGGWIKSSANEK
jgi:hypothetical protein